MRRCCSSALVALLLCACGAAGPANPAPGLRDAAPTDPAASAQLADAASETGAGAANDASSAPAGQDAAEPAHATPAEPCGGALDADNGSVRVDLGTVEQGEAFSGDPLSAGPYQVVELSDQVPNPDRSLSNLPVTLYAPSQDGKAMVDGAHALVLVLPGYGKGFGLTLAGTYPSYAFYSRHLASHGFMVAGMNFAAGGLGLPGLGTAQLGAHFLTAQEKNVDEVKAVLDWLLARSPAKAHIDDSKIAIAGHSEGGKVAFFAAVEDQRIDLVIGWDPQNAGGGSPCGVPGGEMCDRLPIAPNCNAMATGRMHELAAETLIFATRDRATLPDAHQWAEHFYRGAPSPAHMLLFTEGKTESFSDDQNPISQTAMRAQLALLLTRFGGVTGLDPYLVGGEQLQSAGVVLEQYNK